MMEINTNSEIAESDSIKNVDWSAVHQEDFLYEDQCWTTCNGGFCCSNNHPDMAFQLIPTNGTTLLYMESEYAHLKENGLVFENNEGGVQPHDLSFDFGGPRPIVLKQNTNTKKHHDRKSSPVKKVFRGMRVICDTEQNKWCMRGNKTAVIQREGKGSCLKKLA